MLIFSNIKYQYVNKQAKFLNKGIPNLHFFCRVAKRFRTENFTIFVRLVCLIIIYL